MKVLSKELHETWQKLSDFKLDEEGIARPFSKKLSQENNWSSEFTLRAITEYKRFIFLAIVSPDGASPSNIVDQVWHLHLTYTKSYWEEFCGNTLHKSIHHHPSKGGEDEKERHNRWYQQTLQLYKEVFEKEAPPDIWPPLATLSNQPKSETIDISLPISRPAQINGLLLFLIPFLLIILFFQQPIPFFLDGTQFLQFYFLLCFIGVIVVYLFNKDLAEKIEEIARNHLPFFYNIFEAITFLSGKHRALQAAIIDLMKKDIIEIEGNYFINRAFDTYIARYQNPLIPRLLQQQKEYLYYKDFIRMFNEEEISSVQLVTLKNFADKSLWHPALIFIPIVFIGFARVIQGLINDRPVEYLSIVIILFSVIYWIIYKNNSKKTIVEDVFKEKFKQDELSAMALQSHDEILRSFALSGTEAIKNFKEYTVLSTLFAAYSTSSYSGSAARLSSDGSSCGGSSCGSSCGGGCGGCGG